MIKDMYEEIKFEKYNTERQALIEKQEGAMRTVQLKNTYLILNDYKNAFMKYITAAEEEENVIIASFIFFPRVMKNKYISLII